MYIRESKLFKKGENSALKYNNGKVRKFQITQKETPKMAYIVICAISHHLRRNAIIFGALNFMLKSNLI